LAGIARPTHDTGIDQPLQVDAGADTQTVQHEDHILGRDIAGRPLGIGTATEVGGTSVAGVGERLEEIPEKGFFA